MFFTFLTTFIDVAIHFSNSQVCFLKEFPNKRKQGDNFVKTMKYEG